MELIELQMHGACVSRTRGRCEEIGQDMMLILPWWPSCWWISASASEWKPARNCLL